MPFEDADDGAFVIRELTGDRRTISLTGRALPYRPLSLETTHRVETTWYQGSPVATQQPSGAQLAATSVNGWWKDRYLSGEVTVDGIDVGDVSTAVGLALLFEDVADKGQIVEVTWNHVLRVGVLTRFTERWHTPTDLEYEITFDWQSKGQDARIGSTRSTSASLPDAAQEVVGKAVDLDRATEHDAFMEAVGVPVDLTLVERMDRAIGAVQDQIFALEDAISAGADGITAPVSSALRAASIMSLIGFEAGLVAADLRSRVDRTMVAVTSLAKLAEVPPGRAIASSVAAMAAIRASRSVRYSCAQRRTAIARERQASILGIYRANQDEDLRQVATRFYGVPDDWQEIRQFNSLTSSRLDAGQVIVIPRQDVSQR